MCQFVSWQLYTLWRCILWRLGFMCCLKRRMRQRRADMCFQRGLKLKHFPNTCHKLWLASCLPLLSVCMDMWHLHMEAWCRYVQYGAHMICMYGHGYVGAQVCKYFSVCACHRSGRSWCFGCGARANWGSCWKVLALVAPIAVGG